MVMAMAADAPSDMPQFSILEPPGVLELRMMLAERPARVDLSIASIFQASFS